MVGYDLKPFKYDSDKNSRDYDILRGCIITKILSGMDTSDYSTNHFNRLTTGRLPTYFKLKV